MGLENTGNSNGTYIDSLDKNNPESTDALSQADEHLRYIKKTIVETFTGVTGEVTATHTAINNKCAEPVSAITSDGTTPSLNSAAGVTSENLGALIGVTPPAITTVTTDGEATPVLATGITAAEIWSLVKTEALNSTYPVGSIYTSVAKESPEAVFGGTWTEYGAGKVLVGHDFNETPDADFVAASIDGSVELNGGGKTVTASITVPRDGWGNEQVSNKLQEPTPIGHLITGDGTQDNQDFNNLAVASGDRTFTSEVSVLQPYVVVYMYMRTA